MSATVTAVSQHLQRTLHVLKNTVRDLDERYFSSAIKDRLRRSAREYTQEERNGALRSIETDVERPLPEDTQLRRVEIYVLKYKDPEVETKCARHLLSNTEWPFKLVFYDNRPGTRNMAKIWNKLVRHSSCDFVAIIDSDVFVPKLEPCWLTRCMMTFDAHPDCFAVSPMVDNISFNQQRSSVARDVPPKKITEVFANACIVFRKDVFDKVGYYDEDFLFYGADKEWAWRLLRSRECAGYYRPDVVVNHLSHYSWKKASSKTEFDLELDYSERLYVQKTS